MNLRYIEHHVITFPDGKPVIKKAGVWVFGPDFDDALDYAYLPGFQEQEAAANEILNEAVEDHLATGVPLPADILSRIAKDTATDSWGEIVETDQFESIRALEAAVLLG